MPQDDVCKIRGRSSGNGIDQRNHILTRDRGNRSASSNGDQLFAYFPLAIPTPSLTSYVSLDEILGYGCEGGLLLA